MAAQQSRFIGSAKLIAVCTLISRVTGLARDIAMNHVFGQTWIHDAFNYGFLVPNLFRRLFGEGALSAVFVPVFTDVLDKDGRERAWLLLGRVTGLMVLILAVLVLLLEIVVLGIFHFTPDDSMRSLQAGLTAVMGPFMFGVCLVALFSSILNCLDHFTVPSLLPIVLNLLLVLGALVVGPMFGDTLQQQVYGVGVCVLVASLIQLAIIIPVLKRFGVRFRLNLNRDDPDLRRIFRMFMPILIGQGILLFNVFFDAQVCTMLTQGPQDGPTFTLLGHTIEYPLAAGALTAITNAQRLYQFPLGVLAISLATAALPMFSLYASRGETGGLRDAVAQSLRLSIYVGLPSGLILVVLGHPIIALLLEHGRYGPDETARAAAVLQWYGLGMAAFCCQHILLRGFYSLKDTLTPMRISCGLVAFNVVLNVSLLWHPAIREKAFGISTSITATMHVIISTWYLRRRLQGRIGATAIAGSILRTLIATTAATITAAVLLRWTMQLDLSALGRTLAKAVHVFAPLIAAMAIYLLASVALGMQEPRWLLSRRIGKTESV